MLHARVGGASYQEDNQVVNGTVKVILGIPDGQNEYPKLLGFNNQPALTVAGALMMHGVTVAGGPASGLTITGQAWLDECRVATNATRGININGGTATIRRSKIVKNTAGDIVVQGGGMLVLENSFVGGDVNDVAAVQVTDGNASILYSTLGGGYGEAKALTCEEGTSTTVRNSLLVARTDQDELVCPGASLSTSAVEMANVPGTTSLGPMPANTSQWFTGYGDGEFFLAPSHPSAIATAATWKTGDPATDINGDSRPTTDDSVDYAGADRL
jgi:hypothetical protein